VAVTVCGFTALTLYVLSRLKPRPEDPPGG
jgi:hypothetical protein